MLPFKAFIIVFLILFPEICFSGNDKEIFNDLYNEIMNSAIKKEDNTVLSGNVNSNSKSVNDSFVIILPQIDPSVQHDQDLKNKIDKIIEDIEVRHSEAVKFMQNGK